MFLVYMLFIKCLATIYLVVITKVFVKLRINSGLGFA